MRKYYFRAKNSVGRVCVGDIVVIEQTNYYPLDSIVLTLPGLELRNFQDALNTELFGVLTQAFAKPKCNGELVNAPENAPKMPPNSPTYSDSLLLEYT